jgi:hypothetical protein
MDQIPGGVLSLKIMDHQAWGLDKLYPSCPIAPNTHPRNLIAWYLHNHPFFENPSDMVPDSSVPNFQSSLLKHNTQSQHCLLEKDETQILTHHTLLQPQP